MTRHAQPISYPAEEWVEQLAIGAGTLSPGQAAIVVMDPRGDLWFEGRYQTKRAAFRRVPLVRRDGRFNVYVVARSAQGRTVYADATTVIETFREEAGILSIPVKEQSA